MVVDRYFSASDEERRNLGGHDTLRRYWKAWTGHWQVIARTLGEQADCARTAWQRLTERFGTVAEGQCELVNGYGQALLGRYMVHSGRIK